MTMTPACWAVEHNSQLNSIITQLLLQFTRNRQMPYYKGKEIALIPTSYFFALFGSAPSTRINNSSASEAPGKSSNERGFIIGVSSRKSSCSIMGMPNSLSTYAFKTSTVYPSLNYKSDELQSKKNNVHTVCSACDPSGNSNTTVTQVS